MNVNGVMFDGIHSYYDLDMFLASRPDYGTPKPKTNTVEIPGADGVLDMTEANAGEVKFQNRTITLTFSGFVEIDQQEEWKSRIRNALHGKRIERIVPDDDPEWFYSGRASVSFRNIKPQKLKCVVTVDAYPYALRNKRTKIDLLKYTYSILGNDITPTSEEIEIQFTDESAQDWNSDIRLGTSTFPDGIKIPSYAEQKLIIKVPQPQSVPADIYRAGQIEDSDGNVYDFQASLSDEEIEIPLSDVTAANVNLNKVYRILISGLGGCYPVYRTSGYSADVWNERKSAIVTIEFLAGESLTIDVVINGTTFTINHGIHERTDIVLKSGYNSIFIPASILDLNLSTFEIMFQEGRL